MIALDAPQRTARVVGSRRTAGVLVTRARNVLRVAMELTKFRLVSLVLVTSAVGFVLGTAGAVSWGALAITLVGTGLTAGGSMALNELVEMSRDARMQRTRHRPLPAGEIGRPVALGLGLGGVVIGTATLAFGTNALTAGLGLTVVATYVLVYTPLKPVSSVCTLVGAVCGAIPPMRGWSASAGSLGFGAWVLASILFCWQIPHFLALAWLYRDDYARGGFRVLPVLDSSGRATSALANLYIVALMPLGAVAALGGLTGWSSAMVAAVLGLGLFGFGLELARTRSERSARRLFLATLVYLPLVLGALVVNRQQGAVDPVAVDPLRSAPAANQPAAESVTTASPSSTTGL